MVYLLDYTMTHEEMLPFQELRRVRASEIVADAGNFKVCEDCHSIVGKETGRCHVCDHYRFDETVTKVCETAIKMASHPFPVTSAVIPRI